MKSSNFPSRPLLVLVMVAGAIVLDKSAIAEEIPLDVWEAYKEWQDDQPFATALAISEDGAWGWGTSSASTLSEALAIRDCERSSAGGCVIVASGSKPNDGVIIGSRPSDTEKFSTETEQKKQEAATTESISETSAVAISDERKKRVKEDLARDARYLQRLLDRQPTYPKAQLAADAIQRAADLSDPTRPVASDANLATNASEINDLIEALVAYEDQERARLAQRDTATNSSISEGQLNQYARLENDSSISDLEGIWLANWDSVTEKARRLLAVWKSASDQYVGVTWILEQSFDLREISGEWRGPIRTLDGRPIGSLEFALENSRIKILRDTSNSYVGGEISDFLFDTVTIYHSSGNSKNNLSSRAVRSSSGSLILSSQNNRVAEMECEKGPCMPRLLPNHYSMRTVQFSLLSDNKMAWSSNNKIGRVEIAEDLTKNLVLSLRDSFLESEFDFRKLDPGWEVPVLQREFPDGFYPQAYGDEIKILLSKATKSGDVGADPPLNNKIASLGPSDLSSKSQPLEVSSKRSETDDSLDLVFWQSIKDSKNRSMYEAYLRRFPSGIYSELATLKIAELVAPEQTAAPVDLKSIPNLDYGSYRALVIGNNDYESLPALRSAVNDAEAVSRVLSNNYGFKVDLLKNASRSEILRAIGRLRESTSATDNVLIYYAGHGYLDEAVNEGYWLPVDSERDDQSNWILTDRVVSQIRGMRAKHVLVIADSCFSGTITRAIKMRQRTPEPVAENVSRKARTALTSGGLEPVLDSGAGSHSVFATALLSILAGNRGVLDGSELFSRLRPKVVANSTQTPEYGTIHMAGDDGGDFLFVRQ